MTLIVLAALVGAWLVYFVLWFQERRSSPSRPDSMNSFSRALGALARPGVEPRWRGRYADQRPHPQSALGGAPRTAGEATIRRRQALTVLIAVAVASLLAVPTVGTAALAVHLLSDLAIAVFAGVALLRQRSAAVGSSNVRVLYQQPAADADSVVVPLRRAADG